MSTEVEVEVRYAETDKMGIVYHANYLVWFEIARTKFLEERGHPYVRYEEMGYACPVLHAECDYGEPLTYGDTAIVRVNVCQMTSVRVTFHYEVYRKGDIGERPCCSGKTTHCFVHKDSLKPVSLRKVSGALVRMYEESLVPLG